MIIIKKLIKYLKIDCLFILIETLIAFTMGFLNLIGISVYISFIFIFIINLNIFFIFGYYNGKKTNRKGIYEGLITALTLIIPLLIITMIFCIHKFTLITIIYYLILTLISIIGSAYGKNKKEDSSTLNKK